MISPKDLKREGYLSLDFYLTKTCNKSCYYCTSWTKKKQNLEVDMQFLVRILEYLKPYKVRINLLGGEPALVKNLPEVIDKLKSYDNVSPAVLSNSLVRNRYPEILEDPEVAYIEHLVLDFYPDKIEKLGKFDFFDENDKHNYNLIIKTPNFYEYANKYPLNIVHKNTIFKTYNSRSTEYNVIDQAPEIDRKLCSMYPQVPVIDFPLQKIRHCSKKTTNGSRLFDCTQENFDKMMTFELFEFEEYCKTCTEVIGNGGNYKMQNIIDIITL